MAASSSARSTRVMPVMVIGGRRLSLPHPEHFGNGLVRRGQHRTHDDPRRSGAARQAQRRQARRRRSDFGYFLTLGCVAVAMAWMVFLGARTINRLIGGGAVES